MKPITLYKPASLTEATQILVHHGPEAAVYAGGTDLLIRLKNRLNAAPKFLVDIKGIGELSGIRETPEAALRAVLAKAYLPGRRRLNIGAVEPLPALLAFHPEGP